MQGDALARFWGRYKGEKKKSGDGWMVRCPAHDDGDPSLHVSQGIRGVVLRCFTGCDTSNIVAALDMKEEELFDDAGEAKRPPARGYHDENESVSIKKLAGRFGLGVDDLKGFGLRQHGSDVLIPYRGLDGEELFARRRVRMSGKKKVMQPAGVPLVPYGLERLKALLEKPVGKRGLVLVEGESDCWVLWKAGISALGIPGASASKKLEKEHVAGVEQIFIVQEPGDAGDLFVAGLGQHLRENLDFHLPIVVVKMPKGVKDPAELNAADPAGFELAFKTAAVKGKSIEGAVKLDDLVIRLDQVERRAITFLWEPWIPMRKISILAGKPGIGKSYILQAIATHVTNGSPLPGQTGRNEPANVLIFAAEDDASDTLRPRLEDMGADIGRVLVFDLERSSFTFGDENFTMLEMLIERFRPKLVIFDPVVSFMGKRVDINRQNEVRGAIGPLIPIAMRHDVAIVIIAHAKKGTEAAAIDLMMGSVDFSAAVRSAMVAFPDPLLRPGQGEGGILTHAKTNVSRKGGSIRYSIDGTRFAWGAKVDMSADDLATMAAGNVQERGALKEAVAFLEQFLASGPMPANDVRVEAKARGISMTTVTRARWTLNVLTNKSGFQGAYTWSLPTDDGGQSMRQTDRDVARKKTIPFWQKDKFDEDDESLPP